MKTVFSSSYLSVALFGLSIALAVAFFVAREESVSEASSDGGEERAALTTKQPPEVSSSKRSGIPPSSDLPVEPETTVTPSQPSVSGYEALVEKFGSKGEVDQMRQSFNETVEEKGLMNSEQGVSDYLAQAFDEEPVDGLWAYDYETALYEVFANDEILSGKPIKSIECRSVRCRIDIHLKSPDAMLDVNKQLQTALINEEEGLNYALFLGYYSVEAGTGTWYVGRDRTVNLLEDAGNQ